MSSPGLLESMETMAKLWLADTTSSPLLLLLLSFAFSLGSGNAEGSSNGLGDFPLLVFFSLSVCLLGFPVQCAFPCSFSLFRYLPLSFCLRFSAPVPSCFGSCSAPCFFLFQSPVLSAFPSFFVSIVLPFSCRFLPCIFAFFLCFMPCCFPLVFGPLLSGFFLWFFFFVQPCYSPVFWVFLWVLLQFSPLVFGPPKSPTGFVFLLSPFLPLLCSAFYRARACRKPVPLFINPWAGSWARDRGVVALNCRICFLLNRSGPCETEGMVNSGIKTASSCMKKMTDYESVP